MPGHPSQRSFVAGCRASARVTTWLTTVVEVVFVNEAYEESKQLLADLQEHVLQSTYRHRWRTDDLLVWDNHRLQHKATTMSLPAGAERVMLARGSEKGAFRLSPRVLAVGLQASSQPRRLGLRGRLTQAGRPRRRGSEDKEAGAEPEIRSLERKGNLRGWHWSEPTIAAAGRRPTQGEQSMSRRHRGHRNNSLCLIWDPSHARGRAPPRHRPKEWPGGLWRRAALRARGPVVGTASLPHPAGTGLFARRHRECPGLLCRVTALEFKSQIGQCC
eukprot:s2568_g2.t1